MVYDMVVLACMLICLITYSVYIQSLLGFQPQSTYQVYDALGGAQARLLLPKKAESSAYNGTATPASSASSQQAASVKQAWGLVKGPC